MGWWLPALPHPLPHRLCGNLPVHQKACPEDHAIEQLLRRPSVLFARGVSILDHVMRI